MNARTGAKLAMLRRGEVIAAFSLGSIFERRPTGLVIVDHQLGVWAFPTRAVEQALEYLEERNRVVSLPATENATERWGRVERHCWICARASCSPDEHSAHEREMAQLFGSDGAPLTSHAAGLAGVNSMRPRSER
jgi:hypothetical protein